MRPTQQDIFKLYALILLLLSVVFISGKVSAQPEVELAKPTLQTKEGETAKIRRIPKEFDDQATKKVLEGILSEAGWFPNIKIKVEKGLVLVQGKIKDKAHLDWLVATADRLPTVIAVINKVELEEVPASDFSPVVAESRRMLEAGKKQLPKFLVGLVLILAFGFLSRFLVKIARNFWARHINNTFLVSVVSFLSLIPLYAVMLYLTLATLGLSGLASTIIGGTGLLGIVLGFAFKGIAENFLAGILLAVRSPFNKGDSIQVGEFKGIVQNLNMRGTTIMDFDGNLLLIPNAIVIQSVVKNASVNSKVRHMLTIGIGYNESIQDAEEIILNALKEVPEVLQDPPAMVGADNFGSSTINLNIFFWLDTKVSNAMKVRSDVVSLSKTRLLENDIELPDDAREIIIKRPKPEEKKAVTAHQADSQDRAQRAKECKNHDEAVKRISSGVELPGNDGSLL